MSCRTVFREIIKRYLSDYIFKRKICNRKSERATIISSERISVEGTELQKTVDLEENRYMIDKLSHKLIKKLTIYFEKIIRQGIEEQSFLVQYPLETAEFLMTAYVFVSNNMSMKYSDKESLDDYLSAYKIILERTLSAKNLFD